MICIFNCKKTPQTNTLPICSDHLNLMGLQFTLTRMEALVEEPRGLGPFISAFPNSKQEKLYFKMGLTRSQGYIRSVYLPTFKKNEVIVSALGFKNFLKDRQDCPTVEPIPFEDFEKLKEAPANNKYDRIIEEQTKAQRNITSAPLTSPQASKLLMGMLPEYADIFRSGVFATVDTSPDALIYSQVLLPNDYPSPLHTLVSTKYPKFNVNNTVWLGLIYHLFPQSIAYGEEKGHDLGYNCSLQENVGLVAEADIFAGQHLYLKDKNISYADFLCFLPPPTQPAIPGRERG